MTIIARAPWTLCVRPPKEGLILCVLDEFPLIIEI
jgi:hypothetical protein